MSTAPAPEVAAGAVLRTDGQVGFVEEARFRKAWPWQGVDHDSVVYGVLREEWAASRAGAAVAAPGDRGARG